MTITDQASQEQQSEQSAVRKPQTMRKGRFIIRTLSNSVVTGLALFIGLLWSVPTLGLFISSFRPASLISSTGWWTGLVPPWNFTLENYQQVLQAQGFGQVFINSIIISVPGTFFPMIVGALAAYAFAWMKFPGRDLFFLGIVALMIIPLQIAMVPILSLFTAIGLTGQYAAVWLAHTAFGLPFSIYLLRNFFASLPSDLMESAHIDGASHVRIFWSIILPLSVPALASLGIFQFMWVWNDLLIALIFLGGNPQSAPLTLTIANLVNTYGSNYQVLTAAAFISMALPLVVFFSLQRYFVRGILAGSVKG
ncbi:carbohydrate ABC transporter permease [Tengunoibacter tsumagoiensis]|uniref:Sugar ABC transporter permease n=1 Tax=Tengunoibacter tsumagoiensis TaxID=2014871 RepID=A0A402A398_9CHLR|nr:carbohydrate ABC transporter permease [Tengunoibacter tsumagoiensis]GCE13623.1 sugar ABC transporter permease [Tengunoibacter tsumagoiensis]